MLVCFHDCFMNVVFLGSSISVFAPAVIGVGLHDA